MKLVEPGLAPTTSFAASRAARMEGLTPPPYDAFAEAYMARMRDYPTAYSTEGGIAEAVLAAATDDDDRLRYPAGPDTKMLATMRWTTSEDEYLAKVREMFGPRLCLEAMRRSGSLPGRDT